MPKCVLDLINIIIFVNINPLSNKIASDVIGFGAQGINLNIPPNLTQVTGMCLYL